MQKFEIRLTNDDDNTDFQTMEAYAEDLASLAIVVGDAVNNTSVVEFYHGTDYIVICDYSEGGYYFSRYSSKESYAAGDDDISGGLCTSNLNHAISMALEN